jgi:hypothetical protein
VLILIFSISLIWMDKCKGSSSGVSWTNVTIHFFIVLVWPGRW